MCLFGAQCRVDLVSAEYTADGFLHFVNICGSLEAENAVTNFLPLPRLSVWRWQVKKWRNFSMNFVQTGGCSEACRRAVHTCVQPSKSWAPHVGVGRVSASICTVSHTPFARCLLQLDVWEQKIAVEEAKLHIKHPVRIFDQSFNSLDNYTQVTPDRHYSCTKHPLFNRPSLGSLRISHFIKPE
jgi:hypothetical protein